MGWFTRDRKGLSWKDQTLDSMSSPPLSLLVFFGLFIMLLYLSSYSEYKERVERSKMGLRFIMLLMPLVVIMVINIMMIWRRWWRYTTGVPRTVYDTVAEDGGPPWMLLLFLVFLLVMVHYQGSFHSWFRHI